MLIARVYLKHRRLLQQQHALQALPGRLIVGRNFTTPVID